MSYQRILLIDDDEDDQEIFLSALEKVSKKIDCVAYSDARYALQKLERNELFADVIFLDLNMPVMNGEQFLSEVKKNTLLREIPVIIFSTTSHPETIVSVKQNGAKDFITKPDKFDDLVSILKRVVA